MAAQTSRTTKAKSTKTPFNARDVQVAVLNGTAVSGLAQDVSNALAKHGYRAGSITKTFVATVVLQLVDEGRVRLDDPVERRGRDQATVGVAASGIGAVGLVADVSDAEGARGFVRDAHDALGGLDILVTNAGGPPPGPFESHSPETWHSAVRQNLDSVVNLARAVLPGMKRRRWGRIVNVTTSLDSMWRKGMLPYGGSKAANEAHCAIMAEELRGTGVTVRAFVRAWALTQPASCWRITHIGSGCTTETQPRDAAQAFSSHAGVPPPQLRTLFREKDRGCVHGGNPASKPRVRRHARERCPQLSRQRRPSTLARGVDLTMTTSALR